jgi:hypothetical protein
MAGENERLLKQLNQDSGVDRGWSSTMAFYASIHYIEAFFSSRGKHSGDHRTRDSNLIQYSETMTIYTEFCELKAISTRARYHGRYPDKTDYQTQVLPALRAIASEMAKHYTT